MTTPKDWRELIPRFENLESIQTVRRLFQFQREWIDNQAAQMDEIISALTEQEEKLGGRKK